MNSGNTGPNDFPGYNEPLPPSGQPLYSPGASGPGYSAGGPPGQGPREVSFDAITDAWGLLTKSLGVWIGAVLLVGVFVGGLSFVASAAGGGAGAGRNPNNVNFGAMIGLNLLVSLFSILGTIGLTSLALGHVRRGTAEFADFFEGFKQAPQMLGMYILMGLAIMGGFVLCCLPGLLLAALFMLAPFLVLDKKLGPVQALSESMNTLRPQMWMALLFLIVVQLVAGAGIICCYVGLLITQPLASLSMAVLYRNMFGIGPTGLGDGAKPVAPITDPFR